jgi:hypothetical protein
MGDAFSSGVSLWSRFKQWVRDTAVFIGFVLGLFVIGWWWSGPSSDETIVYTAACANGLKMRPSLHAINTETFDRDYTTHRKDRANCVILPMSVTVYTVNVTRGEVYYSSGGGGRRLVDCAIVSSNDWRCAYPDGSGYVTVVDGLKAQDRSDGGYMFSIRRWQYWYATMHGFFSTGGLTGEWLIPEQKAAY